MIKSTIRILSLAISVCFAQHSVSAQEPITVSAAEAIQHLGETVTVCGTVAETRYMADSQSKLTFLNLDHAHPNQIFSVIIEEPDRINFTNAPELEYKNKKICVTGVIEEFKSKAQIRVKLPDQIKVQE